MLNNANETKAFCESKILFSSLKTYVAKVANDTRYGAQIQRKELPTSIYLAFFKISISLLRICPT